MRTPTIQRDGLLRPELKEFHLVATKHHVLGKQIKQAVIHFGGKYLKVTSENNSEQLGVSVLGQCLTKYEISISIFS